MLIEDMGGGSIEQNDIVYPNRGTFINPGANQEINWAFIHDTVLGDTTGDVGFAIDTAAASAAVRGIQCNGCWVASSQNSDGILIANTGASPTVEGLHFLGARIYRNAGHGVAISGGTYIDFEASHICGNNLIAGANTGIAIENGINNVRVRGGEVGGGCDGQASTQAAGIYFVGTSTNTQIQGVDLSNNNTIPIAFGGVVTGRIEGNPGYNPVGAAAIGSPPASGNPYTAGASPETIYLSASGGVSAVTQNGTGVLPAALGNNIVATFDLGPGEILTPTYGGAITMKKMVH
jgi:hypothetical protein